MLIIITPGFFIIRISVVIHVVVGYVLNICDARPHATQKYISNETKISILQFSVCYIFAAD